MIINDHLNNSIYFIVSKKNIIKGLEFSRMAKYPINSKTRTKTTKVKKFRLKFKKLPKHLQSHKKMVVKKM